MNYYISIVLILSYNQLLLMKLLEDDRFLLLTMFLFLLIPDVVVVASIMHTYIIQVSIGFVTDTVNPILERW